MRPGVACILGLASSLHAAVLTIAPDSQIVDVSGGVTVSVQVSGLSGAQVGAYDLIVSWDPAILSLQDATIGTALDGPDRSFHASSTSSGTVSLAEFSFDTLSGQSEPVGLGTLSFVALAPGNAGLSASGNVAGGAAFLGDADGSPLPADIVIAQIKVNGAPMAEAQSVLTDEDVPVSITLGGSDPNGDELEFAVTGWPIIGTLDGTPPILTFTPNTNEHGSDSLTFTVNDGALTSEPATVDITVNPVNDAPVAVNDSASTPEGTPVAIAVLDNDSDVDGDALSISGVSDASNGTVGTDGSSVTYTPVLNFNGSDSFSYTIDDGYGGSASATVTVTVEAGNPCQLFGDVDCDGDVDRDDIGLISAARNTPASSPQDRRDLDGDGMITALDARKAVLECTRPRCATQ